MELRRLRTFSRGSSALLLLITAVMVFLTVVIALGVAQILSDTPSFEEQFGMTFWQTVLFGATLVATLVLVTVTFGLITILSVIYLVMPVVLTVSLCTGESDWTLIAVAAAIIFLPSLFVAALLYMLALVFRYGCWLQKESDETL